MGGKWAPQKAVQIVPVGPFTVVATGTDYDYLLFGCPDNAGFQIEVLSVSCMAVTVPISSDGDVTLDIEWIDDSDSQSVDEIEDGDAVAYDMEAMTANVVNEVWRGSQVLDPGDGINAEITDSGSGATSAAVGLIFLVEYKILERS